MTTTVHKNWDDSNNAAGFRPAKLRVTLSNGTSYILSKDNGWTVTVNNLPKYRNGVEIKYTWSEQSVLGYTQTKVVTDGNVTTFTNTFNIIPPPGSDRPGNKLTLIEDNQTALGIDVVINHVGDCFE